MANVMITALEGLDSLVFTAGIGENGSVVHAAICARLGWTGLTLDPKASITNVPRISRADSCVAVRVIPTNKKRRIAKQAVALPTQEQDAWRH